MQAGRLVTIFVLPYVNQASRAKSMEKIANSLSVSGFEEAKVILKSLGHDGLKVHTDLSAHHISLVSHQTPGIIVYLFL